MAMTPDDIWEMACRTTGLSDLDSDSWRTGLKVLLDELNACSTVTDKGRHGQIGKYVTALGNRLRVHDYVKQHPEVLEQTVERPLVTLGMPRTGTTVVSYLLDQDPARRSLLHWEPVHLVPPATSDTLRTDPRCLAMLDEQKQILDMVRMNNIPLAHWEDADGPTEDMFLHAQDFKGLSWDAYSPTPRYGEWLMHEADMTSAYEYQKLMLQILQSKAPGIWSLKMPSHAVHIETLLKVFPDVRILWAHRDPYTATGSLCNMWIPAQRQTLNDSDIDREALGRRAIAQMREHVERPMRIRRQIGDERFFDMHYAEMMRDPMRVMRRMYAWAEDDFSPEVEQRMMTWLTEHPRNRFAPNAYTLGEYGLSVEMLAPIFADYVSAFAIELDQVN